MLRKSTRSIQKDQHHTGQMAISDTNYESYSLSHYLWSDAESNSIFNVPLMFVVMGPLGLLDSDSVKSPIPSQDVSSLRTPRTLSNERQQRSWNFAKVGLSIIDSLEECSKFSGKILHASESKKTSLSPQMITKTLNCKSYMDSAQASKSSPKDLYKIPCTQSSSIFPKVEATVVFEIGETLIDHEPYGKTVPSSLSGLTCSNFDSNSENFALNQISSSNEFIKSLSASEIENSEDYTCVISHGPNPKTTHIFYDCILETRNQYPSDYFLSFCYHCNKKLEEGKDIYMYRGEKAFCSVSCRTIKIMIDEEQEKSNSSSENSSMWKFLAIATESMEHEDMSDHLS